MSETAVTSDRERHELNTTIAQQKTTSLMRTDPQETVKQHYRVTKPQGMQKYVQVGPDLEESSASRQDTETEFCRLFCSGLLKERACYVLVTSAPCQLPT